MTDRAIIPDVADSEWHVIPHDPFAVRQGGKLRLLAMPDADAETWAERCVKASDVAARACLALKTHDKLVALLRQVLRDESDYDMLRDETLEAIEALLKEVG